MPRVSYGELREISNVLQGRGGSLPADVGEGRLRTYPVGTSVPTAPGRTPARPVPASRSPLSVVGAMVDVSCALYGAAPNAFVTDLAPSPGPTISNSTKHGLMQNICGAPPGPDPAGAGGALPPAPNGQRTQGGQCEDIEYRVTVIVSGTVQGTQIVPIQGTFWGPISSPSQPRNAGADVFWTSDFTARESLGGPLQVQQLGTYTTEEPESPPPFFSLTATPVDDVEDTCGDSEPPYPEGQLPTGTPGVDINPFDGGPPISFDPDFSIGAGANGPTLNINLGDFNIGIDLGGVDINFPDAPDRPPGGGGGNGDDGGASGDPDEPVEPPPPDDPDPPTEPEDPERILRGAIVTVSNGLGGSTQVLPNGGGPPFFFPDLGLVSFQVVTDDGRVAWTPPQRLQQRQGYYEPEVFFGCRDVRVTTRPGLTARVNKVYDVVEAPTTPT